MSNGPATAAPLGISIAMTTPPSVGSTIRTREGPRSDPWRMGSSPGRWRAGCREAPTPPRFPSTDVAPKAAEVARLRRSPVPAARSQRRRSSPILPVGGRCAMNAAIPSAASCVRIKSSKHSRSSSGSIWRTRAERRTAPRRRRGAMPRPSAAPGAGEPTLDLGLEARGGVTNSTRPASRHSEGSVLTGDHGTRRASHTDAQRQQGGSGGRKYAKRNLRQSEHGVVGRR